MDETPKPLTPPIDRLLALVESDSRNRGSIAAAAGMSPAQFSHIMTGHRADPSVSTVARILAALGKSWKDLDPPTERRKSALRP